MDVKQVYVTPEWVQSVIDGNQEESDNYVILECSWGNRGRFTCIRRSAYPWRIPYEYR
ncbi:MAG: hypothetical protein QM793_02720 [Muricomes sp.]